MTLALADTARMPLWKGEEDAPPAFYTWGTYTKLGPFQPQWAASSRLIPFTVRIEHRARHNVRLRTAGLRRWATNLLREAGDRLVGSFAPLGSGL